MVLFFKRLMQAVILLLVQWVLLSHVSIMGYATPMPYILVILTFGVDTEKNKLLVSGFLLGVIADVFTNTPGVGAASCTLVALLQPYVLNLTNFREIEEQGWLPSFKTLGFWGFVRYAAAMVFLFQLAYYLLLAFSLVHPLDIFINTIGGTIFTLILLIPLASAFQKKEKNLS